MTYKKSNSAEFAMNVAMNVFQFESYSVKPNYCITKKVIIRRAYNNKGYSNFFRLNVPEDDIECEPFTVIFIDSLQVYDKKHYQQVYLDNCAYKTVNKQMTDYLNENLFED